MLQLRMAIVALVKCPPTIECPLRMSFSTLYYFLLDQLSFIQTKRKLKTRGGSKGTPSSMRDIDRDLCVSVKATNA